MRRLVKWLLILAVVRRGLRGRRALRPAVPQGQVRPPVHHRRRLHRQGRDRRQLVRADQAGPVGERRVVRLRADRRDQGGLQRQGDQGPAPGRSTRGSSRSACDREQAGPGHPAGRTAPGSSPSSTRPWPTRSGPSSSARPTRTTSPTQEMDHSYARLALYAQIDLAEANIKVAEAGLRERQDQPRVHQDQVPGGRDRDRPQGGPRADRRRRVPDARRCSSSAWR